MIYLIIHPMRIIFFSFWNVSSHLKSLLIYSSEESHYYWCGASQIPASKRKQWVSSLFLPRSSKVTTPIRVHSAGGSAGSHRKLALTVSQARESNRTTNCEVLINTPRKVRRVEGTILYVLGDYAGIFLTWFKVSSNCKSLPVTWISST